MQRIMHELGIFGIQGKNDNGEKKEIIKDFFSLFLIFFEYIYI